jgi:hypothetical protein
MIKTFIKLPNGDFEIEQIRKIVSEININEFKLTKWHPLPALIDKKSGSIHLYRGQRFDPLYFELDKEGWTHDHCIICFNRISETSDKPYFNDVDWICKSCYESLFKLLDQYKK